MSEVQISAKKDVNGEERSAMITYDFGDTIAEMTDKFGEEVVKSNAIRNFKITAQAAIRRMLEAGKSQEEIQDAFSAWKPGVQLERSVDVTGAFLTKWQNMTDEERQEMLKKMQDSEA